MKLNWDVDWGFVSVVVAILIVIIGWGVSVEVRMAQHASLNTVQESVDAIGSRTQNIEKLLLPIIVDYKVRKELENMSASHTTPEPSIGLKVSPKMTIKATGPKKAEDIEHRAQHWAEQEIMRGQQQAVEKK